MPVVSKLNKEEWREIQEACVAGVEYAVIAERYDIEVNAIRIRAHKEKWATPNRVQALRSKHQSVSSNQSEKGMTDGKEMIGNEGGKTASLIAESLDEAVNSSGLLVGRELAGQIRQAFQSPDQFRPENLKDLQAAVNILWKVSGKDKPQTNVQVNLWDREGYAQSTRSESEKDEWD